MELLNFNKANCQHCYKCLRVCPVKAIKFKNDQASIVEERCIACGHCFIECPQNARKVHTDLPFVKGAIEEGRQVIATVAPSYFGAFQLKRAGQIVSALKSLGFNYVEETAIGADIVSSLYEKELKSGKYNNIITTACPSANFLIEKYYPSLTKYMIPIVSPMLAHGKVLKHNYGINSFVVFIGPCIAKKVEADEPQHNDVIDAVLTFEELDEWLMEEKISLPNLKSLPFDRNSTERGRGYPLDGGVLNSFLKGSSDIRYDVINVDGVDECIDFLEILNSDRISGVCAELNACRGGCVNGPGMPKNNMNRYKREKRVKEYIKNRDSNFTYKKVDIPKDIDFGKLFIDKSFPRPNVTDAQIEKVLNSIDKHTTKDELNCSACGYPSCRDKAIAVIEGMAETSMCMPYMKSKAERLSNHIFEYSPNAIFVLDNNLNVVEFNPVCEKVFNISSEEIIGYPIATIIDDSIFQRVINSREDVIMEKVYYEKYGVVLLQNIINIENEGAMLVIMTDVTTSDRDKEELIRIRENTLNAAQDVIDKQMRVAQEIAGLLGETTAETKVVLTKLKEFVLKDGDIK